MATPTFNEIAFNYQKSFPKHFVNDYDIIFNITRYMKTTIGINNIPNIQIMETLYERCHIRKTDYYNGTNFYQNISEDQFFKKISIYNIMIENDLYIIIKFYTSSYDFFLPIDFNTILDEENGFAQAIYLT